MGRFIPHPDDVPVELTLLKPECISRQQLHTISLGGIACNYHRAWRHGTALQVRMPTLNADFAYPGYVAWCLRRKKGYLVGIAFKGKYKGQRQKWFALRFTGQDADIDLTAHDPEFSAFQWVSLELLPDLIVPFKRDTYKTVIAAFRNLG